MEVDLSLYLVTDSRPQILGDRDLCDVVEEALKGGERRVCFQFNDGLKLTRLISGVTVVQYRDKHGDTGPVIETAQKLHMITQAYKVPLIINDRIDVALVVGAEGVHVGQDDMGTGLKPQILAGYNTNKFPCPRYCPGSEAAPRRLHYWGHRFVCCGGSHCY